MFRFAGIMGLCLNVSVKLTKRLLERSGITISLTYLHFDLLRQGQFANEGGAFMAPPILILPQMITVSFNAVIAGDFPEMLNLTFGESKSGFQSNPM